MCCAVTCAAFLLCSISSAQYCSSYIRACRAVLCCALALVNERRPCLFISAANTFSHRILRVACLPLFLLLLLSSIIVRAQSFLPLFSLRASRSVFALNDAPLFLRRLQSVRVQIQLARLSSAYVIVVLNRSTLFLSLSLFGAVRRPPCALW